MIRKSIFFILIAGILLFLNTYSLATPYKKYYGIYALPTKGKINKEIFEKSFVKGISIRIPWKVLEPEEGKFKWEKLDKIIQQAKKANKYITLRIMTGIYSPRWIFDDPDIPKLKFISKNRNKKKFFGKEVTLPVLWNQNYLKKYFNFLKKLGKRYGDEPILFWVAVSGPATGPATPHLPKAPSTLEVFQEHGFTNEKWLQVWKWAIDETAEAFPNKPISMCIDVPRFYIEMAQELAEYAVSKYKGRICLQSNGMSARVLKAVERRPIFKRFFSIFTTYQNEAIIGFQMTWAAAWKNQGRDRLGPLDKAIEAALKFGAKYLEIYQDDIIDPANEHILMDLKKRLND